MATIILAEIVPSISLRKNYFVLMSVLEGFEDRGAVYLDANGSEPDNGF